MSFIQNAPCLPHPLQQDRLLQHLMAHELDAERRRAILPDLQALADYALDAWQRQHTQPEQRPVHTPWSAWGKRIDRIHLTTTWQEGAALATRHRLLIAGYDENAGSTRRLEQFMRVYMYHMASEFYTCPLAMTDGAIKALKASGNHDLMNRALPHFLSSDPDSFWLSGQWMTENIGGSDVSQSETQACCDEQGQWRLYGRKWFTSAIVGEAAMALAKPQGHQDLALFYVETKTSDGAWNGVTIDRIKDKLGTRQLPTAEIHLDGVPAWPVGELNHGVRQIMPVLNITRTWNTICAIASMQRCIALACDYANKRQAFGRYLADHPLHARTLADMQAEFSAAFSLGFYITRQLGRIETGEANDEDISLFRLAMPLAKLWTGKLAIAIASESLECFGGNGYIEDTGLPQLLRDAQVYAIWEGTTNVLSLDSLRAIHTQGLDPVYHLLEGLSPTAPTQTAFEAIHNTLRQVQRWLKQTGNNTTAMQASARQLATTLARILAGACLLRHAQKNPDLQPALTVFIAHGLWRLNDHHTSSTDQPLIAPYPC